VPQNTPSFKSKQITPAPASQMGVAKSDFSQMRRRRSDLIKNAEHFAGIDLDRSRFEKECNHCDMLFNVYQSAHFAYCHFLCEVIVL